MKFDFAPVLLWAALAVTGLSREALYQATIPQQEPRVGQPQDLAIRWQFDTHG